MQTGKRLPTDDLEALLIEGRSLWKDFAGKRVLITGGTGFFGKWLLSAIDLANVRFGLGCSVFVMTRDPNRFQKEFSHTCDSRTIRLVEGSPVSFDTDSLRKVVSPDEGTLDFVLHMATEGNLEQTLQNPVTAIDTIAGSTGRILELARQLGATRFLLTSSGSVYERGRANRPIPETFPFGPDPLDVSSANAISGCAKRHAEALCAAYARQFGMGVSIARCFAFLAPELRLDGKFAAGNFIGDALARRDIVVKGDGQAVRSYMYGTDLVVWLLAILLKGRPGAAYNVGSSESIDLRGLAELVATSAGPVLTVRILGQSSPRTQSDYYVPNVDLARKELGLRETLTLEKIVKKTLAWHGSS